MKMKEMNIRKTVILLFALLFGTASQAEMIPFTQGAFEALQKRDRPILVVVFADWCPTCKRQEAILSQLLALDEFRALQTFRVDFDNQRQVVEAFHVKYQSTLILFHGSQEVARSTAETDRERIVELLRRVP